MELDALIDKAILVKVKNNLGAVCKRQRTLKKQYLDIIQDTTNLKAVFDKVIKQLVTIKLQDLLAYSLTFTKLLFKSVLVQTKAKVLTASVRLIKLRQRTKQAYVTKTPKLLVKVNRALTQAMLDTRAKVNVITKAAANELRLLVCTNLLLVLKAVLENIRVFDKACKNVEINIRSVVNY
jgi:hypothetical protein